MEGYKLIMSKIIMSKKFLIIIFKMNNYLDLNNFPWKINIIHK